jgi:rhodanese-related sulfurtransferase
VRAKLKEGVRNMLKAVLAMGLILMCFSSAAYSGESTLEQYISSFSYQERKDMKIDSKELVKLVKEKKVQLVDVRFKEEFEAWRMGFAVNIPLNELPKRLNEFDKDKLIVTACPHKDRAAIAMVYLKTKGFNVKYLEDGLLSLAEHLRGDRAKDFIR